MSLDWPLFWGVLCAAADAEDVRLIDQTFSLQADVLRVRSLQWQMQWSVLWFGCVQLCTGYRMVYKQEA